MFGCYDEMSDIINLPWEKIVLAHSVDVSTYGQLAYCHGTRSETAHHVKMG